VPLPKQKRPMVKEKNDNGHFTGAEVPQPRMEAVEAPDLVNVDDILSNPILTPSEVGTLLRVSPETVMRLARDGELPAMRVHKETRLLRIDVLRFIKDLHEQQQRHKQWVADNPRFGGSG
jgi:excisionase family DNA binding protein